LGAVIEVGDLLALQSDLNCRVFIEAFDVFADRVDVVV
jgi:hypothetical protein